MENTITSLAKQDLSRRLSLAENEIALKSMEAVCWEDSSLGCPQPGEVYAQVVTPGYRLVLSVGELEFEYHSDRSRRVIRCMAPGMATD